MADFLTRLAERTLGVAPVAQPIIGSMLAKGRASHSSTSEVEAFTVQDGERVAPEPITRPNFSRTAPQSPHAIPGANPSYQVPATSGQPLLRIPESQVAPQPQDLPQFSEHVEAELPPPMVIEGTANQIVTMLQDVETELAATVVKGSMLPGLDVGSREEQPNAVLRQDTSPKEPRANISLVGKSLAHSQEGLASTEHVALPDEQAGRVGEMVQGIDEVKPYAIAQQGAIAHDQHTNTPLVGGHLTHRQESLTSPRDAPPERIVLYDTPSAMGGEIVQRGRPGGASLGDVIADSSSCMEIQTSPKQLVGLDSIPQQSTPTVKRDNLLPEQQPLLVPDVQQRQGTSSRQQTDLALTNERSGNPGGGRLQFAASLAQNQQATTSQGSAAPTIETDSSTPTIRVTIGRIDVRAVAPPAPTPHPKPVRAGPTLSLDDYSRQRKGGGR